MREVLLSYAIMGYATVEIYDGGVTGSSVWITIRGEECGGSRLGYDGDCIWLVV